MLCARGRHAPQRESLAFSVRLHSWGGWRRWKWERKGWNGVGIPLTRPTVLLNEIIAFGWHLFTNSCTQNLLAQRASGESVFGCPTKNLLVLVNRTGGNFEPCSDTNLCWEYVCTRMYVIAFEKEQECVCVCVWARVRACVQERERLKCTGGGEETDRDKNNSTCVHILFCQWIKKSTFQLKMNGTILVQVSRNKSWVRTNANDLKNGVIISEPAWLLWCFGWSE